MRRQQVIGIATGAIAVAVSLAQGLDPMTNGVIWALIGWAVAEWVIGGRERRQDIAAAEAAGLLGPGVRREGRKPVG